MLGFSAILFIIISFGILGWLLWIEYKIDNPPSIPETESEKYVRDMKERIRVAEWRFKRSIGEV
tara:strand:+ start:5822 stop:6013 length:192 start_codon:yes stop_codon:yes gene_type:complete